MKIIIAGPGAGKTTKLADLVLSEQYSSKSRKRSFVMTYTNIATQVISEKLKCNVSFQSEIVSISTIHSFLLSELIFPYYHFLYNQKFTRAISIDLPDNPNFRNQRLGQLHESNVIDNSEVFEKAKHVVVGKADDKKSIKLIRKRVLASLTSYIGSVYIDEAQDIDKHVAEIILTFGENGIQVTLIGDPKQNLHSRTGFSNLAELYKPEFISDNYRSPLNHVSMLNMFVPEEEIQVCRSGGNGELIFILGDKVPISVVISQQWDLVYIYEKFAEFQTKSSDNPNLRFFQIILVVVESLRIADAEKVSFYILQNANNKKGFKEKRVIDFLQDRANCTLSKLQMRQVYEAFDKIKTSQQPHTYKVSSIDSIKGCEGLRCLYILTTDVIEYLLNPKRPYNKCKAKLFVALSRSKKNLTLFVHTSVILKYGQDKIKRTLENMGFTDQSDSYLVREIECL